MLKGQDVAEHQKSVDWDKVAGKHGLGLVRVADGANRLDATCEKVYAKGGFGRYARW